MNLEIEQSLRNDRKLRESSINTYRSTFNKVAKQFDLEGTWCRVVKTKCRQGAELGCHTETWVKGSHLLIAVSAP